MGGNQKNTETYELAFVPSLPAIERNNSDPRWKIKLNCDPILQNR